jgi:nucleoside-diphosphate-sugar epimerase
VSEKVGLIFGVSGIAGRAIAERLSSEKNWTVIGASRHAPDDLPAVHHVTCDLQDRDGCRDALATLPTRRMHSLQRGAAKPASENLHTRRHRAG